MIKIKENPLGGTGFDTLHTFDGWKTAFITSAPQYGQLKVWKRHLCTDETFILLKGNATIYTLDENGKTVETPMQAEKLYVVEKATWHHVQVSNDALLFVVENSDTSKENTEQMTAEQWKNPKENTI